MIRAACAHVLAKGTAAQAFEAHFCGNRTTFTSLAPQ